MICLATNGVSVKRFELQAHFDTNHHLTVMWNPEKPAEAGKKLKATIRATLPKPSEHWKYSIGFASDIVNSSLFQPKKGAQGVRKPLNGRRGTQPQRKASSQFGRFTQWLFDQHVIGFVRAIAKHVKPVVAFVLQ